MVGTTWKIRCIASSAVIVPQYVRLWNLAGHIPGYLLQKMHTYVLCLSSRYFIALKLIPRWDSNIEIKTGPELPTQRILVTLLHPALNPFETAARTIGCSELDWEPHASTSSCLDETSSHQDFGSSSWRILQSTDRQTKIFADICMLLQRPQQAPTEAWWSQCETMLTESLYDPKRPLSA